MSSGLEGEREESLERLKTRLQVSRVFAIGGALACPAALVLYLYILYAGQNFSKDVAAWNYFVAALFNTSLFLPSIALCTMVYWHTRDMHTAAVKGEIFFLRKLNSGGWGWASLTLSNLPLLVVTYILVGSPAWYNVIYFYVALMVVISAIGVLLLASKGEISRLSIPADVRYDSGALLSVSHLVKYFDIRRSFSQSIARSSGGKVHAVDDVSFEVQRAQVFGLAGESGSGKTTVLRAALALTRPSGGSVIFKGRSISEMSKGERANYTRKVQIVFQDPYESTNPRMSVFEIIAEGLHVNNLVSSREEAVERVTKALKDVQLSPAEEYMPRFPHELSGGQRQRVAIARAVVLDPEIILADEPVSMLDVSIRAEVLNTLLALRQSRGISILMVTHDLALSKDIVDELAIMYVGKIVETGQAEEVVMSPYHPYTRALTAAVPVPDPEGQRVQVLAKGEIPTNVSPPSGCRFHPRCAFAKAICAEKEPPLEEVVPGRRVACHFWKEAHEAFSKGLDKPIEVISGA